MANNLESNFREKIMPAVLEGFDNERVYTKTVNTQLLDGMSSAKAGESVAFKRETDYVEISTTDGDLTGEDISPIVVGNSFGRVQNFSTVIVEMDLIERALKIGNEAELLKPAMKRLATKFDQNFANFMMKNTGLLAGTPGNAVNGWEDVAQAGAVMRATGVPMDNDWYYAVNPFTQVALANQNRGLGAGGAAGGSIKTALDKATIDSNFAGMNVITATTQSLYTSGAGADRTGALASNPDVTYVTAKDTLTQSLAVTGMTTALVIKAGEQVQITGRNRLNLSTRDLVVDATGAPIVWTGTVLNDVTLSGGAGTLVVSGPAIYEVGGAFNTVDSAPVAGDVVTVLGADGATHQPNLFWHKNAFSIGTIALPKLSAQQNTATTQDGVRIKSTRGSDIITGKDIVRFDILPAYMVNTPFMSGQGFGTS